MAKYQQYAEYKDSEVEWLGEIPQHWISTQVKYGYAVVLGKMLQTTPKSNSDLLKPYLKAQNVQPYGIDITNVGSMWFSADERKRLLLKGKDILVSEGGDVGRAAIWNNEIDECYIQNAINRVRPRHTNDSRFFYYWINYLKATDFINIICNKATIAHYTADKLQGSPLILPSALEQTQIANFLDYETTQIDTLIEKQKTLIQLLKEKRQAVISHAVAKGLNPDVPMKYSGVEWLGEVPAHWDIVKLSYKMKLLSGDGITSQDIEPVGQYSVYGGNGLRGYTTRYNCDGHYVLIGRQGALCGNINLAKGKFFATEHAVVVYPYQDFDITFLSEFLRFMDLGQYSVSAAQPGISVERINGLKILVPPYDEQIEIGIYIKKIVENFKSLSMKANQQIQLLRERRTALISAAVTGKIDVRGWLAPDNA